MRNFEVFNKANLVFNTFVKCHQRRGLRGEAVRREREDVHEGQESRETQQSQQAARVEELVDPVEMSDTAGSHWTGDTAGFVYK